MSDFSLESPRGESDGSAINGDSAKGKPNQELDQLALPQPALSLHPPHEGSSSDIQQQRDDKEHKPEPNQGGALEWTCFSKFSSNRATEGRGRHEEIGPNVGRITNHHGHRHRLAKCAPKAKDQGSQNASTRIGKLN